MLQPLQNDLLSDEQFVHAHSVNVFSATTTHPRTVLQGQREDPAS
jgi:hypothetical protein